MIAPPHMGKRAARKLSSGSQKLIRNTMRTAFKRIKIVKRFTQWINPAEGYKIPKQKRTTKSWTYLTREEIPRLLAAFGDDPERWIIQFAIGVGPRSEEQWLIHLDDVHAYGDNPRVEIKYGKYKRDANDRLTFECCKGSGPRTVPLFGLGLDAVREWLKVLPSYAPKNPLRLLFPRPV
jgi:integrase